MEREFLSSFKFLNTCNWKPVLNSYLLLGRDFLSFSQKALHWTPHHWRSGCKGAIQQNVILFIISRWTSYCVSVANKISCIFCLISLFQMVYMETWCWRNFTRESQIQRCSWWKCFTQLFVQKWWNVTIQCHQGLCDQCAEYFLIVNGT